MQLLDTFWVTLTGAGVASVFLICEAMWSRFGFGWKRLYFSCRWNLL